MKSLFLRLCVLVGIGAPAACLAGVLLSRPLPATRPVMDLPRVEFPWSHAVPPQLAAASVDPDQVFTEAPCNWRPAITPLAQDLVKDCRTAREAVLTMAAKLPAATGVYYTTDRRKANMNALEALAEKKVSCTGQSILLACALRAVGIPARVCGLLTWHHIQGNHTWTEAWFDGEWHMIEFNEKDFNSAWVMSYIGMLDPAVPFEHIKAVTPDGKDTFYPPLIAAQIGLPPTAAEDVTERYMELSRRWHEKNGQPANVQRLLVDVQPRTAEPRTIILLAADGTEIDRGTLPLVSDDANKLTTLNLPRTGQCYLQLPGSPDKLPVQATQNAVQMLRLKADK